MPNPFYQIYEGATIMTGAKPFFLNNTEDNNWLPQLEKYLQTRETEYALVGAGHLLGEDGIIAQLRKRGYAVERF